MAKEKMINARLQQKHDLEKNWMLAENFIPKIGELIIYDAETSIEDITDKEGNLIREDIYNYSRFKIGDGITTVDNLAFADDNLRNELEKYKEILNIDYESTLAFDTSEIVIGQSTTSILGQAILGKMILG